MNVSENNKKLVEEFCNSVFVNHDLTRLEYFMKEDYIQHNADVPQGREGFRSFFEQTFKAMPDFKYTLNKIIAEENMVWIYCTTTATHTDAPWLDVEPRGNRLKFNVVDIFRIEDGKIAEHWDVADTLSLFGQLGKV
jgi:predicted SnoaL-like aldol condensation-catalyzing enzyme